MATTKKYWRRITVDGENYRWMIRRKASYFNYIADAPMRFVVENAMGGLLIVTLSRPRLDSWFSDKGSSDFRPITPAEVADVIRRAKKQDWKTTEKSAPFSLKVEPVNSTQ